VELEIEIENDDNDFQDYPSTSYPGTTSAPPPQNPTLPDSATTDSAPPAQPNQSLTNPGSTNNTTPPSATAPATNSTQAVNSTKSANPLPVFIVLLFFGVGIFLVVYLLIRLILSLLKRRKAATNELDNDIVTVSKLQVALFAHTPNLQSELSELALTVDTTTPEGLLELLQESALVLLRHSDTWSHLLSSSQSVNIEEAKTLFTKLSVEERSKFSAETLSNVGGRMRQKVAVMPDAQEDPAAYIVVTLLVGTADDHPLFGDIRSAETLNQALQKVASVRPDYLMTVELLWSPQSQDDSLTYDELLTEYTDMIQII